ncbi:hypothetical protein AMTR_s00008p00038810 [Amborella trichopoda]|uniref:Uncharacterized protein n=1 Tax=Amborella trichopoda TaxID=13333 RepID=W1NIE5_AMBTC|nr:hypothetical protein AMTR_s00008p00038810 [Amborella trichopoda]
MDLNFSLLWPLYLYSEILHKQTVTAIAQTVLDEYTVASLENEEKDKSSKPIIVTLSEILASLLPGA